MPLESGTYINSLDAANPTSSDGLAQGDDHIRFLKSTVKSTFPNITGAITGTHTQLNNVVARIGDATTSAEARTALDVYSKAEVDASIVSAVPAGAVIYVAKNTTPTGYLKANGATVSRTTYATLFAAIGITFGAGDGSTTFVLPDLRGEFIRGWDDGRLVDSGRSFGSAQSNSIAPHQHYLLGGSGAVSDWFGGSSEAYGAGIGSLDTGAQTASTGVNIATETRPRNVALLACIKY